MENNGEAMVSFCKTPNVDRWRAPARAYSKAARAGARHPCGYMDTYGNQLKTYGQQWKTMENNVILEKHGDVL